MTKAMQIAPARAKKKLADTSELHLVDGHSTEQKIDGERYLIHTYTENEHAVTSRRISEVTGYYVEKTDRVPHISRHKNLPQESVLDSEFVSSSDIVLLDLPGKYWDKMFKHPHTDWLKNKFNGALPVYPHVGNTVSIMGSAPDRAVRLQMERGIIWSYCFDILFYKMQRVTKNSQFKRREFLAKLLEAVDPEDGVILMPSWPSLSREEKEELFFLITDIKGEGLIYKALEHPYDHAQAWWKHKRDYPVDVVLTGNYKMGNAGVTGKMVGKVGSLEFGVYNDKGFVQQVGWMSAIMDSEAKLNELTNMALEGQLAGLVVEARHNGIQKGAQMTLRHPRFRRWRYELNPIDCTLKKLIADAS